MRSQALERHEWHKMPGLSADAHRQRKSWTTVAARLSMIETCRVFRIRVNGSVGHMESLTRFNSVPIASPNIQKGKPDLRFVRWNREEVFHGPVGSWVTG
jgi:hypothetical protein